MCWIALDRAVELAERGVDAGSSCASAGARGRRDPRLDRGGGWDETRADLRARAGAGAELDAALLTLAFCAYSDPSDRRMLGTIDAIRRELDAGGPLLDRYTGAEQKEGAFLTCSFWLVDALARGGRATRRTS